MLEGLGKLSAAEQAAEVVRGVLNCVGTEKAGTEALQYLKEQKAACLAKHDAAVKVGSPCEYSARSLGRQRIQLCGKEGCARLQHAALGPR
jgi:hypothetical protein